MTIVTVQMTTAPPPLPEPLHCWTAVTRSVNVVVVVTQVPAPAPMGPAAPTHRVTVDVEDGEAASVPVAVR